MPKINTRGTEIPPGPPAARGGAPVNIPLSIMYVLAPWRGVTTVYAGYSIRDFQYPIEKPHTEYAIGLHWAGSGTLSNSGNSQIMQQTYRKNLDLEDTGRTYENHTKYTNAPGAKGSITVRVWSLPGVEVFVRDVMPI